MEDLAYLTADVRNSDRLYRQQIERSSRHNWLGIKVTDVFAKIIAFLEAL